jgi:hypothetical protein
VAERSLGRRTVAFVSGIDMRRDVSAALVTLGPNPPLAARRLTAALSGLRRKYGRTERRHWWMLREDAGPDV